MRRTWEGIGCDSCNLIGGNVKDRNKNMKEGVGHKEKKDKKNKKTKKRALHGLLQICVELNLHQMGLTSQVSAPENLACSGNLPSLSCPPYR